MIGTQGLVLLIFLVTTGFVKADTDQCMLIFHLILLGIPGPHLAKLIIKTYF